MESGCLPGKPWKMLTPPSYLWKATTHSCCWSEHLDCWKQTLGETSFVVKIIFVWVWDSVSCVPRKEGKIHSDENLFIVSTFRGFHRVVQQRVWSPKSHMRGECFLSQIMHKPQTWMWHSQELAMLCTE